MGGAPLNLFRSPRGVLFYFRSDNRPQREWKKLRSIHDINALEAQHIKGRHFFYSQRLFKWLIINNIIYRMIFSKKLF